MCSPISTKRPDCETILKQRNEWALSLSELKTKNYIHLNEIKSNVEIFHKHFIKVKLNI